MKRRPVGKKAEPTAEELEFIYSRLGTLSDQEVLEEMQSEEFPVRSVGFIKRRRREYNAAKRVLQTQIQKEVDPIISKDRAEHFEHLAEIASVLWSPTVNCEPRDITLITNERDDFDYLVGDYDEPEYLTSACT